MIQVDFVHAQQEEEATSKSNDGKASDKTQSTGSAASGEGEKDGSKEEEDDNIVFSQHVTILRNSTALQNYVLKSAQPCLVLVYAIEGCDWCGLPMKEFAKASKRMKESLGGAIGFYGIEVIPQKEFKLATEVDATKVPEIRMFTDKSMFNVHQKKLWRPSTKFTKDAMLTSSGIIRSALAGLTSTVTVLKDEEVDKHATAINDIKTSSSNAEGGLFLIFTDKVTVAPIMKSLAVALDGRAKFQQIVINPEKINESTEANSIAKKYGITADSLPSLVVLGVDLKPRTYALPKVASNKPLFKEIYSFADPILPEPIKKKPKKLDEEKEEDKKPTVDPPIIIKTAKEFKSFVLLAKMPSVVAFRLNKPKSIPNDAKTPYALGDVPIDNWTGYAKSLKDIGFQAYIVHCDDEDWCPDSFKQQKKKGKVWVYRSYSFDQRSTDEKNDDPDEKEYIDAFDLEEAKEEAISSLPNLVSLMSHIAEQGPWAGRAIKEEKLLPVIIYGSENDIPVFLSSVAANMANVAKFAYCANCDLEMLRQTGLLLPNEDLTTLSYIIISIYENPNPTKKARDEDDKYMVTTYDRTIYGKVGFTSTIAWTLSVIRSIDQNAYQNFIKNQRTPPPTPTYSSSSGEKKTTKTESAPKGIDTNAPVEELIDWKQSCGSSVTQGNLVCVVAFLNSASGPETDQYREIFKSVRNEALKAGSSTSTQFKFYWVDAMCHGEFGDKVFGLDPSSTPAIYAYYPIKSYKSQLIGSFSEKNILSWIEVIRSGKGFTPLPKTLTAQNVDEKWKKMDCENERKKLAEELKKMETESKEDL